MSVTAIGLSIILTGGSTAFGFTESQKTIKGTHIEIVSSKNGIYYKTLIGKTKTSEIFAILEESGIYRIDFTDQSSLWLRIQAIFLETVNFTERLDVPNLYRENDENGGKTVYVRRTVLEAMNETEIPTIFLKGQDGAVIRSLKLYTFQGLSFYSASI